MNLLLEKKLLLTILFKIFINNVTVLNCNAYWNIERLLLYTTINMHYNNVIMPVSILIIIQ